MGRFLESEIKRQGRGRLEKVTKKLCNFPRFLPYHGDRLHELGGSGSKTCTNISYSFFFFFFKGKIKNKSSMLSIEYNSHHPRY